MDRNDHQIVRLRVTADLIGDPHGCALGKRGENIDAGNLGGRSPRGGCPARHAGERKHEHTMIPGDRKYRQRASFREIASRAGELDLQVRKSFQGVEQAATAPIEDMIVRECAAIDRGGAQADGVFWTSSGS